MNDRRRHFTFKTLVDPVKRTAWISWSETETVLSKSAVGTDDLNSKFEAVELKLIMLKELK